MMDDYFIFQLSFISFTQTVYLITELVKKLETVLRGIIPHLPREKILAELNDLDNAFQMHNIGSQDIAPE